MTPAGQDTEFAVELATRQWQVVDAVVDNEVKWGLVVSSLDIVTNLGADEPADDAAEAPGAIREVISGQVGKPLPEWPMRDQTWK